MSKMRVAGPADDLCSEHAQTAVLAKFNLGKVRRLGKARPAGSGVKFGIRRKKFGSTANTAICAITVVIEKGAGKGPLGCPLSGDFVNFTWQFAFPFGVRVKFFRSF